MKCSATRVEAYLILPRWPDMVYGLGRLAGRHQLLSGGKAELGQSPFDVVVNGPR